MWQCGGCQLRYCLGGIDYVQGVVSLMDEEGVSVEDIKEELRYFVQVKPLPSMTCPQTHFLGKAHRGVGDTSTISR